MLNSPSHRRRPVVPGYRFGVAIVLLLMIVNSATARIVANDDDADDKANQEGAAKDKKSELSPEEEALQRALAAASSLPRGRDERNERLAESEALLQEVIRKFELTDAAKRARYHLANCRRRLGSIELAIADYEDFLAARLESEKAKELVSHARLQLGMCRYTMHDWQPALAEFEHVYKEHADTAEAPEAMYRAGLCLRELTRFDDAKKLWDQLQREHATAKATTQANRKRSTLRPAIERLKDLIPAFERERAKFEKLPFKQRPKGVANVEKALAEFGDVHDPKTVAYLHDLFKSSRGEIQAAVVKPLMSVGDARSAKLLIEALDDVAPAARRDILDGLKRRNVKGLSLAKVRECAARQGDVSSAEAALRLLGRVGTLDAAKALIDCVVAAKSFDEQSSAARRTNGLIARMLRSFRDEDAWRFLSEKVLLSKRASLMSRLLVAEALGYSKYRSAAEHLRKMLADRSALLPVVAAESLGRLADPDCVGALVAQLKKRRAQLPFVRAAIEALTHVDPTAAVSMLIIHAHSSDVAVRTLVAQALGRVNDPAACQSNIAALEDPAWQVRRAALKAVGEHPSIALIDKLVERLEKEDGALLPDVLRLLIAFTGVDYGPHPARWKEYWEFARPDFDVSEIAAAKAEKRGKSSTYVRRADAGKVDSPTYFGVEIISKRVAFIVDCSGSMSAKVSVPNESGGRSESTRIELAKSELIGAISKLRNGTFFNIVRFSSAFASMSKKLVKLSRKSVKKANGFAAGLGAAGGTNIFDSLEFVLKAGDVDTIFLLSDGAPSAGKYTDATQILEEIHRLNATSQVTIHTIAIGFDSALMRRLAEQNQGNYVLVGR